MHKVKAFFCVSLGLLALAGLLLAPGDRSAAAGPIHVAYEADYLPTVDPVAPWIQLGYGSPEISVADGVLRLVDPGFDSWVLFQRIEPLLGNHVAVTVEARVRVPWNNGVLATPDIRICNYDPARPWTDVMWLTYAVELYPDHISFTKHDNDAGGARTTFGSLAVPDLASAFHAVSLTRIEGPTRSFEVRLDGVPVLQIAGEPVSRPLDTIAFGPSRSDGAGESEWDYVRYWSEEPVPAQGTTWGRVKAERR